MFEVLESRFHQAKSLRRGLRSALRSLVWSLETSLFGTFSVPLMIARLLFIFLFPSLSHLGVSLFGIPFWVVLKESQKENTHTFFVGVHFPFGRLISQTTLMARDPSALASLMKQVPRALIKRWPGPRGRDYMEVGNHRFCILSCCLMSWLKTNTGEWGVPCVETNELQSTCGRAL